MKIIDNLKKVLIGIGAFLLSIPTKVFAKTSMPDPVYGIRNPKPKYNFINSVWDICRIFIIPVALLIGLIVYFKKSKSSKKRKIITSLIILGVVIALSFGINYIVDNVI